MSCELSLLSHIQDIRSVRKFLFPHLHEDSVKSEDAFETWDDSDWGWHDETQDENTAEAATSVTWLQDCHVALSPTADLLAVAYGDKLVLLTQRWSTSEEHVQTYYSISSQSCLKQEEGESINALMCLPLASQKRSTQGGPDWTCVIAGFSSGYVRMYTENGTLLLSQIFSEEPVQKLKCRTYEPPRHSADGEKHEELSILYLKSLVTIDGFSLFQSLRACRNQVARAAASGSDWIQPPPLAYKKWGLQDQDTIVDHTTCGLVTPNPFDQMYVGSMIGGHSASIRPTPPASQLYVTAGMGPYVGFFHAIEGSAQPMLSDVAHAVASKLKSALFNQISAASGWLGFGAKSPTEEKEKKKPKIEPATSLPSRFGLHDKRRDGEAIVLSPDSKMAAVTDSFGRVMLLDVWRGVAVRMWKGYRDAQVGWVDVKEDLSQDPSKPSNAACRHAMFLIIYAPRRGILEVWTAQQGPRVAAFNVSKSCLLLCNMHSLMGLNNVTYKDVRVPLHYIYLVDPEGSIKTIDIPFHLVLSDKNSKRARDMHLLKKLKITLKENDAEGGSLQSEIIDALLDMKIASIRQQGLERVLQTKYLSPELLQTVNKAVIKQLEGQASGYVEREEESLDYESRTLLQYCHAQRHLLRTFVTLRQLNAHVGEQDIAMETGSEHQTLCRVLSLTEDEVQTLLTELDKYHSILPQKSHVRFQDDATLTVQEFLSCFQCQMSRSPGGGAVGQEVGVENEGGRAESQGGEANSVGVGAKSEGGGASHIKVELQHGIHDNRMTKLATFLFRSPLEMGTSTEYNMLLNDSHIPPDNLMSLLLHLWLREDRKYLEDLVPLHSLVKSISCLKSPGDILVEHNVVCPWWASIRQACCQSHNISSALLAALVARSVAMEMARAATEQSLSSSCGSDRMDLSEYESVTMDRTHWTVLIKQLEDLLAVQSLLQMSPASDGLVKKPAWEPENISVCVKKVLDGGRGVLPELVAKWIAGQGIPPSMLCQSVDKPSNNAMDTDQGQASSTNNPIISQLQEVQRRLPHSLDSDILMANCAWEYMVLWNKDAEVTYPMEQAIAFLKCIQNAVLQHGLSAMIWHMFLVKKLSSAAFLMEKVGKAPKDRLCRKDVGLSDISLEKFMKITVELLEVMIQAREDAKEEPILNVEDLWQTAQGPTSLVELAAEQKETNPALLRHHFSLSVIMHATLTFSMRSVKPLSMFHSKGRNALFKPLHSVPDLKSRSVEDSIHSCRRQFLCRVVSQAVQTLGDHDDVSPGSVPSSPHPEAGPPSLSLTPRPAASYLRWPQLLHRVASDLRVEVDEIRRRHVCELYSSGLDKMAEEVLLTTTSHKLVGSQLLMIAGQRLAHYILVSDPATSVEKLAKCSPTVSSWLKTLDASQLRYPQCPLSDTAALVGNVVNQLPEKHAEYPLAIELVELVQALS